MGILVGHPFANANHGCNREIPNRLMFLQVFRRTNVQQLTCKIDLSSSFYYLFFSFVLLELKPLVFKWKLLGEIF